MPEDILVCLEYFAAFDPRYHEPEMRQAESENPVYDAFCRKTNNQRQSTVAELG
jgi:hypothetical protein